MSSNLGFDGALTCAMQCANLDKSIEWYQDVLGFSLLYRVDEIGWCELESPVARVNVGLSQVESLNVKGGTTMTFGVTDIETARAQLEAKNVSFDGETVTYPGMVRLATFYDVDGNKLMLFEDLSGQE